MILGKIPRVVGSLSCVAPDFPSADHEVPCDIVEIRLDEIQGQEDRIDPYRLIQANEIPVLLTIRLSNEGGKWKKSDESRLEIYESELEKVFAVDVEFKSKIAERVCHTAKQLNKVCIVSYHDFLKTPPFADLFTVISQAQEFASVVKISTMIQGQQDIDNLRSLLLNSWKVPICVIGMGSLGTHTRLIFPAMGSCLTYGYLDKPSAPGQLPASRLVQHLRCMLPTYNEDYIIRKQVLEFV